MKKKTQWILGSALVAAFIGGCATVPSDADLDKLTEQIARASFSDRNIISADKVLNADETNRLCSVADMSGKPLDDATAKRLEATNLKSIKWPSDGKFLGDWKQGEQIAQSGAGATWNDKAVGVNGGNCYNCHQISKQEISFGTIGPSLYNYGKLRGVTDPASPASQPVVEYTWGKIWNARAYNACSQMPRAGHNGFLTEQQIKNVMALLLDPKSPVNQ